MHDILEMFRERCGICSCLNVSALDHICRTALPWTPLPGSLCLAMNEAYLDKALANPNISGIVLPPALEQRAASAAVEGKALILAELAEELFYRTHMARIHDRGQTPAVMVEPYIDDSAQIHQTAIIDPAVCIEAEVSIGPYAVIGPNTIIGAGTWIGSQAVLGEENFSQRRFSDGKVHIPHFGGVRIGPRCRLHARAIVAPALYFGEYTELGEEVFMGFQTSVSHDSIIGARTDIAIKATINGRTVVGEDVWVGPLACVSNTLHIGDKAKVLLGSVLIDDVPSGARVSGNFAIDHKKNRLEQARKIQSS